MLSWFALCALGHTYLDRTAASAYMALWKPQVVGGHIASLSGIKRYGCAREALHHAHCIGAVVHDGDDNSKCMFVLNRHNETVWVTAALHSSPKHRRANMVAFRQWYDDRFFEDIYGNLLADNEDRAEWEALTAEE